MFRIGQGSQEVLRGLLRKGFRKGLEQQQPVLVKIHGSDSSEQLAKCGPWCNGTRLAGRGCCHDMFGLATRCHDICMNRHPQHCVMHDIITRTSYAKNPATELSSPRKEPFAS